MKKKVREREREKQFNIYSFVLLSFFFDAGFPVFDC